MKILNVNNIFDNNLCIFVDASIQKSGASYIGCPGCLVILDNNILEYTDYIRLDSTNNRSEISAIQLGIEKALKYRKYAKNINLFSDSKICIYSLKEWIYKWCDNIHDGIIYGSSATPVNNQDIIINIINTILYNNLRINLFHQKGHVRINDQKSIECARKVFIESNNIDIDYDLLCMISNNNNKVDINTKNTLARLDIQNKRLSNSLRFSLDGFDRYKYKDLTTINLYNK